MEEVGRRGTLLENLIVEITAPDSSSKTGELLSAPRAASFLSPLLSHSFAAVETCPGVLTTPVLIPHGLWVVLTEVPNSKQLQQFCCDPARQEQLQGNEG